MSLKLQAPAVGLPLTVEEAKLHLRVSGAAEDALITALIGAATLEAEHIMGRAVMPQKWALSLDAFASTIELQRPPVTGVDSVKYVAADTGTLTTLDPSAYQFAGASDYAARVLPAYGQSWPAARAQPEAVQVVFSAGYPDAANVPELIKAWIKLRLGSLFEQREGWSLGQKIERNEHVDLLLDRYRTWAL